MVTAKKIILVSACLLGAQTKYNGGHNMDSSICDLQKNVQMIPVCPEQLGGLPTPRPAAEIVGGRGQDVLVRKSRVMTAEGEDRTECFLRGARITGHLADILGAEAALFKANSPSCGCGEIYDGSFCGAKMVGDGVASAFLKNQGLPVFTETNLKEFRHWLTAHS